MREVLERYAAAFRVIRAPIFLGVLPIVVLVWAFAVAVNNGDVAVDFHHELYPQANLLLDWENPYPPLDADLSDGTNTIWPIAAAALVAPLAPLPTGLADGVMTALVIASFAAALLVMGVRDWRVFGAVDLVARDLQCDPDGEPHAAALPAGGVGLALPGPALDRGPRARRRTRAEVLPLATRGLAASRCGAGSRR